MLAKDGITIGCANAIPRSVLNEILGPGLHDFILCETKDSLTWGEVCAKITRRRNKKNKKDYGECEWRVLWYSDVVNKVVDGSDVPVTATFHGY